MIVNVMGMAFKMTNLQYKRMLEDIRDTGTHADPLRYGATQLGLIVSVTDIGPDDARQLIKELERQRNA